MVSNNQKQNKMTPTILLFETTHTLAIFAIAALFIAIARYFSYFRAKKNVSDFDPDFHKMVQEKMDNIETTDNYSFTWRLKELMRLKKVLIDGNHTAAFGRLARLEFNLLKIGITTEQLCVEYSVEKQEMMIVDPKGDCICFMKELYPATEKNVTRLNSEQKHAIITNLKCSPRYILNRYISTKKHNPSNNVGILFPN